MKNKSMWIAAVIMIPLVILVSFICVKESKNMGTIAGFAIGQAELRNTIEIPLSEANSLEADYGSPNLKIYPTDGDTIIIKEYLHSDAATAECVIENKKATVKSRKTITLVLMGTGERIEIYLPKEGIKELDLKTASGNITADEAFAITAEEVSIAAASGNIKWRDTDAKKAYFTAASGNIKVFDIVAEEVVVTTASGNIDTENVTGILTATAASGNIDALAVKGCGSVTASSGNVKMELEEVTGDISLKTNSGGVKLLLPKGLSFTFEAQTSSGNISTAFDEQLSYNKKGNQASGTVGASPAFAVSAKASSGNVKITEQ